MMTDTSTDTMIDAIADNYNLIHYVELHRRASPAPGQIEWKRVAAFRIGSARVGEVISALRRNLEGGRHYELRCQMLTSGMDALQVRFTATQDSI